MDTNQIPMTNEEITNQLLDISRGYDHGNFESAYSGQSLEEMLDGISDKSEDYRMAAIISFFSSYELEEMGEDLDQYEEAYFSTVGEICREQGYCDERPGLL